MWRCGRCETINNSKKDNCSVCWGTKEVRLKPTWKKRFSLLALIAGVFILGFVVSVLLLGNDDTGENSPIEIAEYLEPKEPESELGGEDDKSWYGEDVDPADNIEEENDEGQEDVPSVEEVREERIYDSSIYGFYNPFPGVIFIDFASEEELANHPDAPRYVWQDDAHWMVFSLEESVQDVVFVMVMNMGWNDQKNISLYVVDELLYEVGDVAANEPFFIQTVGHFGTMPRQAVGFTYTNGLRYYIPFSQPQADDSPPMLLHTWSAFTFTPIYRVRFTWEDIASQIGAFSVLENAIDATPEGYRVFDGHGNIVYVR